MSAIGRVASTGSSFDILMADSGVEFLNVPAARPRLRAGQRVSWTYCPEEVPAPGRRRHAYQVRVVE